MNREIFFQAGMGIVVGAVLLALFAPFVAGYAPDEFSGPPLAKPSADHLLGTNDLGQDILSRLIYGTRATLIIGFLGALVAVAIGTMIGIVAGYYGGKIDEMISRIVDVMMTIPTFPLLLVLTVLLSPGIYVISLLMGVIGGAHSCRVIRSQVLSLAETNHILGAKALGLSNPYIMARHILPNVLPLIIVKYVFSAQGFMLMGVGLGFLGIGDAAVIDWGQMINRAYSSGAFALGMWWWIGPPGLAVTVLSIGLAMIGFGLEDRLNPRLRHKNVEAIA
ncbi:ABC transporter permease [Methanofollis formosanus]|uniref:ABC transporter permease n=1 Tax=Methanofollis formosanus TaxID=299308 RepID=A0A8G1A2U7_9EURY|nr:ABC transporter permease [Methanofollis formosanus]QYZ79359.1 ABC transporter permease [Methanofollis formosanus]